MKRQIGHAARAGATAVAAAAGLMALASTGQTPDGLVHANFGGPLSLFGEPAETQSDVLAIGDGPTDPTELAALLQTAAPSADPDAPFRVAIESNSTTNATELSVFPTTGPTSAPTDKQSARIQDKPVVDAQGRIDCRNATSCETDPATNITKVTYPDGVVALVQKINDMTLIAYQNVGDALKAPLQALAPHLSPAQPPVTAARPAAPVPAAAVPAPAAGAPATQVPVVDPGPAAPDVKPEITASTVRPRVTVTRPPMDFSPDDADDSAPITGPTSIVQPPKVSEALDAVKGAVDSVVGAIGKALGPGASTSPSTDADTDPGN